MDIHPAILFRYHAQAVYNANELTGCEICLSSFAVEKTTPKGVWIFDHNGKYRWVSLNTRKAYAYPTKTEALNSFRIRNEHRQAHLDHALSLSLYATEALKEADLTYTGTSLFPLFKME